MNTDQITVVIADDHPMIRAGLSAVFQQSPTIRLLAEATNGADAVAKCSELKPDVVIIDLRMPVLGGLDAMREMQRRKLETRPIIFTTFDGEEDVYRGFEVGARGYLMKEASPEEILNSVKMVATGRKHISPEIAEKLADRMHGDELSRRELEILGHLCSGRSNKAIARIAHIGEGTVKFHVNNILGKLGVASRTSAVLAGFKRGLIEMQ
jgi:DNA-binding NarL/FixJ family response regulator